MTSYSCVKRYTARSFPKDLIIEVGDVVCVCDGKFSRSFFIIKEVS